LLHGRLESIVPSRYDPLIKASWPGRCPFI
jgi:hypothetical protein